MGMRYSKHWQTWKSRGNGKMQGDPAPPSTKRGSGLNYMREIEKCIGKSWQIKKMLSVSHKMRSDLDLHLSRYGITTEILMLNYGDSGDKQ